MGLQEWIKQTPVSYKRPGMNTNPFVLGNKRHTRVKSFDNCFEKLNEESVVLFSIVFYALPRRIDASSRFSSPCLDTAHDRLIPTNPTFIPPVSSSDSLGAGPKVSGKTVH